MGKALKRGVGAVRRLPAGKEPIQAAEDSLVVEAARLLQPQDAQEGMDVVAAGPDGSLVPLGLRGDVILVRNG